MAKKVLRKPCLLKKEDRRNCLERRGEGDGERRGKASHMSVLEVRMEDGGREGDGEEQRKDE